MEVLAQIVCRYSFAERAYDRTGVALRGRLQTELQARSERQDFFRQV